MSPLQHGQCNSTGLFLFLGFLKASARYFEMKKFLGRYYVREHGLIVLIYHRYAGFLAPVRVQIPLVQSPARTQNRYQEATHRLLKISF